MSWLLAHISPQSWKLTPITHPSSVRSPPMRQHNTPTTQTVTRGGGGRWRGGSQNWYLNYGKQWSLVIVVNLISGNINAISSFSLLIRTFTRFLVWTFEQDERSSLLFQSSIVKCFISDQTKEQQHNENWLSLGHPAAHNLNIAIKCRNLLQVSGLQVDK